jgi:hypothetical protein
MQTNHIILTVVGKESDHPDWHGPGELKTQNFPKDHAVNAAVHVFRGRQCSLLR